MTRPRFANTSASANSRRPKTGDTETIEQESTLPLIDDRPGASSNNFPSIREFMAQHMQAEMKEPTRPITLRFEESLWQKVEKLRGPLTKNDFFKYLLDYYEKSETDQPI